MRLNMYVSKTNIGKVRTQLTVSLSSYECKDPPKLKLGLLWTELFCQRDTIDVGKFKKMVSDCISTLNVILKDNNRLRIYKDDPEMLEDMHYRLYESYSTTPDLRLAMLDSLSETHNRRSQFAEAGFAKLYAAAMVADYLKYKGQLSFGSEAFKSISSNIEPLLLGVDGNPEDDGMCQSQAFTEAGFVQLIEQSIALFKKAQLFETAATVCKVLVPTYEAVCCIVCALCTNHSFIDEEL
jgi:hypothetical protein